MSFNYDGDPAATTITQVRFLIGDTTDEGHVAEDEEIEWALTQESDVWFAAALVADAVGNKHAQYPTSEMISETNITWGESAQRFYALAEKLRNQRRMSTPGAPWVGGYSKEQKRDEESDLDREELVSPKGVHDNTIDPVIG